MSKQCELSAALPVLDVDREREGHWFNPERKHTAGRRMALKGWDQGNFGLDHKTINIEWRPDGGDPAFLKCFFFLNRTSRVDMHQEKYKMTPSSYLNIC